MSLVREIDPHDDAEIALVAARMRDTLVEVVDAERGGAMYTMDWLVDRVRFHLDPARSTAAVFVVQRDDEIVGHTIVRVEEDTNGECGLVSTTYVVPAHRRGGCASALLARAQEWMREQNLRRAATHTAATNTKLICLYEKGGYRIVLRKDDMVRLEREL